ncbi:MAG: crossover junction endodeoxyribonuclease RuvC [Nitrospinae bacterium CG11_big_fil_rev_8_21_14_0_20_56_8]|nr:MAG: crossover junction endodeoxyribonuclease RuvC [Nitrospinae bacterium CG11_big_fil_rev_8_21_14_0_20_56_8]
MGIDPGSNCTGYGIIEERNGRLSAVHWGCVRNPPGMDFPQRLKRIYEELIAVIREFSPGMVAVENLFFAVNAKSALKLGQTRGVTLLAAVTQDLPVAEYSPLEIKQAVAGYGRADKHQVREMVTRLLNLKERPEPFDASDALAIAICHLHSAHTRNLIAKELKR